MSAFNWVIVENICSGCGMLSHIRCQTHVAADYRGDASGRLHDNEYLLGEEMHWWPQEHPRYETWRANGVIEDVAPDETDTECCYATCTECSANLYVVIKFLGPRTVSVESIGLEDQWPARFYK